MEMQLKIFSSPQSTSTGAIIKFTPFRSINAFTTVGWLLQDQCIVSFFVLFSIPPSSTQISLGWFSLFLLHQHVRHLSWAEPCSVMCGNSKLSPLCLEIFTYFSQAVLKFLLVHCYWGVEKMLVWTAESRLTPRREPQGSMSLMFYYWTNLIYTDKQSVQ